MCCESLGLCYLCGVATQKFVNILSVSMYVDASLCTHMYVCSMPE